MRYHRLAILCFILIVSCYSRTDKDEVAEMAKRFDRFLHAAQYDIADSLSAYTYPQLIELKSRRGAIDHVRVPLQYLKALWELDSIKRDSVYPLIRSGNSRYALITYTVVCYERPDVNRLEQSAIDTGEIQHAIGVDHYPAPQVTLMRTLLRNKVNMELVHEYEMGDKRVSKLKGYCIAIKDKFATGWSFFNVTEDQELLNKLIPADVLKELSKHNKE